MSCALFTPFLYRLVTLLGIKLHLTQATRRDGATYKSCEAQGVRYDYERLLKNRGGEVDEKEAMQRARGGR